MIKRSQIAPKHFKSKYKQLVEEAMKQYEEYKEKQDKIEEKKQRWLSIKPTEFELKYGLIPAAKLAITDQKSD